MTRCTEPLTTGGARFPQVERQGGIPAVRDDVGPRYGHWSAIPSYGKHHEPSRPFRGTHEERPWKANNLWGSIGG
jgi:hypothetical protein